MRSPISARPRNRVNRARRFRRGVVSRDHALADFGEDSFPAITRSPKSANAFCHQKQRSPKSARGRSPVSRRPPKSARPVSRIFVAFSGTEGSRTVTERPEMSGRVGGTCQGPSPPPGRVCGACQGQLPMSGRVGGTCHRLSPTSGRVCGTCHRASPTSGKVGGTCHRASPTSGKVCDTCHDASPAAGTLRGPWRRASPAALGTSTTEPKKPASKAPASQSA